MESVESKLGYYPKCPYCENDHGFDVTLCPHTLGAGGMCELVSCKSCHKIINVSCPPVDQES